MDKPRIEINPEAHTPETKKRQLWMIMGLSAFIDIMTTTGTIATLGFGVILEEIIENLVSQAIAKFGGLKLNAIDNTVGLAPIPGVTAVTVHCARKLFAAYFTPAKA